ncbi:MAG: flagellar motor switch protein FliN [Gammaproteobacteria bacterium]|nr:flagellar motor switch protein FliN [Gammaproteobacteria bacterium]
MDEAKTSDTTVAPAATAQPFQAPALDGSAAAATTAGNDARPNIDVILDVPVTLSLEVGRAQMSVGRLLRLSQGSVVELDRSAGEPLDVLVNGTLVAHGEIVIVNDKFGIRLTDVVPPGKRVGAQG